MPTYLLTGNARTVSIDHAAGVAVRHPQIVAAGRHFGTQVHTCYATSGVAGTVIACR